MKKGTTFLRVIYVLLATAVLGLQSCKKNEERILDPTNNGSDGSLKAIIAHTNWQATYINAIDSANMIIIYGSMTNTVGDNFPIMIVSFPHNIAAGTTIHFKAGQRSSLEYMESSNYVFSAEPTFGGSGSLSISKFDKGNKHIEGTFSADVRNINRDGTFKNITSGKFAINYD